jgi:predicted NBD/HSP70 family sugar kinase
MLIWYFKKPFITLILFVMAEVADLKASIIDIKKSRLKQGILKELYFSRANTIAEFSRLLHTSVPSITNLIEELNQEHWVIENGIGASRFGRKPTLYTLNPDYKRVLILDISTHDTRLILFNLQNEILQEEVIDLPIGHRSDFTQRLCAAINRFFSSFKLRQSSLLAIGVSMPGLINPETGLNYTYPSIQSEGSINTTLEQQFGAPTFVINDSKATVLGEYHFGLGRGKKHVMAINIDWGIGLGVMVNGELLNGASGFAVEFSHNQVDPNGELCLCGKIGCLDTIASASTLLRKVKKGIHEGKASRLVALGDEINIEMVVDAANQGDEFAIDLLHQIGIQLGRGLSTAIHFFNPEVLIVDGVLAKAGRFFINPIEQAINKYCLADFKKDLSIHVSELGDRSKLLGTMSCVMEHILADAYETAS